MPRVMVVDDEREIVTVVGEALRRDGYEVVEACDGHECLEKIRRDRPDLVLLDIMMPELDGLEVCRAIKTDKTLKDIKVAVFTV